MELIKILLSIVIGFFATKFVSGKKEGEQGRFKSLKFSVGVYVIQLHHWLIGTMILGFLMYYKFYNGYVYGLVMGMILQGLTYRDFYRIIYRKNGNRQVNPPASDPEGTR